MSTASRDDAPSQAPTEEVVTPKVIKRYSNRKLYDTDRSKYVTLDEIARMIKAGEEVTIIDNETKEDLTSVTLTQIIYEEEKRESRMPLGMLRNLIQASGTTLQDLFDRSVKAPVEQAQKSVEKSVEELRQSAVNIREAATRSVAELTDSLKRMLRIEERKAEELTRALVVLFDHLDERVTERAGDVASALESVRAEASEQPEPDRERTVEQAVERLAVRAHVQLLRDRIHRLEEKTVALEAAQNAPAPAEPAPTEEPPPPAES